MKANQLTNGAQIQISYGVMNEGATGVVLDTGEDFYPFALLLITAGYGMGSIKRINGSETERGIGWKRAA